MLRHIFRTLLPAIFAVLIFASCSDIKYSPDSDPLPRNSLESLNATIAQAARYQRLKEMELDSLKAAAREETSPVSRWLSLLKVSETYRQVDADSALRYAEIAMKITSDLPDTVNTYRGELAFIDALATAGIFPPALQRLDSLGQVLPSVADRISYWKTARRCYSYIMDWGDDHDYYTDAYRTKYIACDDSLLLHLPTDNRFREFIFCEHLVDIQHLAEAGNRLESLIAVLPPESNLYGMAAFQLALVHRLKNDFNGYARYLALAAESDIKGCVREGLALPTLANWVYEHGDIDNAFRYVNYTLEDANTGNIRMRTTSIAPIIPLIDKAIQRRSTSSRNQMMAYIIITTLLFLATIILLFFTFSSLRKLRLSQKKLEASSKKLESYVGNFIGLCSNYAARLEQLSRLVTRKIASGQSDELVKLISSGKFAEENNDDFYRLIDKALLDIFPEFVEQINSLLKPDCRIEITPDQPLTPELRIYAFVRLGVDQSSRIAQILGYSVNTVYAYRNRMRNKASDRDNFDLQVASFT